jgi:hypothetical protein
VLADPQSVTISGAAKSLPQTDLLKETGVYSNKAEGLTLYVSQRDTDKSSIPKHRSSVSLRRDKVAADPLTAVLQSLDGSTTISFAYPAGFTSAEIVADFTGLVARLQASTNAVLLQILGGER